MPHGGEIEITTTNRYLDMPVKGYDAIEEGDYVVMTVTDNGMGIASIDIDRIFEPFFTKKTMGRSGTGLGMAVVWGTVKDHRGYIDVQSQVGKGSRFSLYFPATRKERNVVQDEAPISTYAGNGEEILIVDDVDSQRQIASDMLLQLGYRVQAVSSGEKAVEYLISNRVDVILLDMIMDPGMDGLDTYKKIVELVPNQKTIIASGFSETERVREALQMGAGPYIRKPYTWIKLGQAVKTALAR
jgi:two-component system cell cycle sensor histidine kinase/response regulator CckA